MCLFLNCDEKVENLLGHPPVCGDAGHNDALRSRGGHSLESPPPKLLKELLFLQLLEAGSDALRSKRWRGATGAELERTRGLHLWCLSLRTKNNIVYTLMETLGPAGCSGAVQVLNEIFPSTVTALRDPLLSKQRVNVSARLSAPRSSMGAWGEGQKLTLSN